MDLEKAYQLVCSKHLLKARGETFEPSIHSPDEWGCTVEADWVMTLTRFRCENVSLESRCSCLLKSVN